METGGDENIQLYQLDWFEQYMTKEMKDRRMITDDTASQH